MIDPDKLTPAPWEASPFFGEVKGPWNPDICNRPQVVCQDRVKPSPQADLEFIALARNVVAIQERRQWSVLHCKNNMWLVGFIRDDQVWPPEMPDEFKTIIKAWEAMVEADKWITQQEEKTHE